MRWSHAVRCPAFSAIAMPPAPKSSPCWARVRASAATFAGLLAGASDAPPRPLVSANFKDSDAPYGHRRAPAGYAGAPESLDARLPPSARARPPGALAIITADHGCDP